MEDCVCRILCPTILRWFGSICGKSNYSLLLVSLHLFLFRASMILCFIPSSTSGPITHKFSHINANTLGKRIRVSTMSEMP